MDLLTFAGAFFPVVSVGTLADVGPYGVSAGSGGGTLVLVGEAFVNIYKRQNEKKSNTAQIQ